MSAPKLSGRWSSQKQVKLEGYKGGQEESGWPADEGWIGQTQQVNQKVNSGSPQITQAGMIVKIVSGQHDTGTNVLEQCRAHPSSSAQKGLISKQVQRRQSVKIYILPTLKELQDCILSP